MENTSNNENEWRELAKDPKRKAKSKDPGWKYAFYPNLGNKDVVKCVLCGNENHGGINRLKQHLIGGYPDIHKCPKTTREIAGVMSEYIATTRSKKRNKAEVQLDIVDDEDDEVQEIGSTGASNTAPRCSKNKPLGFQPKVSKSVGSMVMRTPEQVIEDRHAKGPSQTTIESRLRTPEEKTRVHMHIANFFYECGIPFNAANSRSYEVMVESIGQYGPGLKPPTFHELRKPLLKKAKEDTDKLKEKHEKAWQKYGCTLMSDGWTDRRGRHLINFLANSPEGTFFLGSVNASSESHDAPMLANLLHSKIKEIGEKNVVQLVTDNGANYKAAAELLETRIHTLFWTPCAAHCIDLMLEDIGKLTGFKRTINQARRCTTFIYRHGRVLDALREKTNGRDIVRPGATRPALAEIASAMDFAKNKVKASFEKKQALLNKVLRIINDRWENQMGKPLYGAALFLNPGGYFDLLENNPSYASRLREDFNDVLEKMITDRITRDKISNYADDYKNSREGFAREMALEHRKLKSPLDWWDAYGGRALELQSFAKRIVGLCCSSSGCERNWSTFEFIHTKKRNRLEHQRLNDLVYIQYNRKIDSRFKKRRELGRNFDPLVLDDFEWNNEWISAEEDTFWSAVDVAQGASHALEGRNFPRRIHGVSTSHQGGSSSVVNDEIVTYTRRHTSFTLRDEDLDEEATPIDDDDVEDDYGVSSPEPSKANDEEGYGDGGDIEIDDFA
ncbi:hypothetical protein OROGR_002597 [Orobanche gracilis]